MNDVTSTDMTPFFERHDRKSRRVFVSVLSATVVVAAAIFTYGVLTTGAPGKVLARQWMPIVFYPLFFAVFWAGVATWGRSRPAPTGGRLLMNPDDARNIARVANAGSIFVACLGVVVVASQAGIALKQFGILQSLYERGDWLGRAILVASGALMIYFGNAWSRMPTPRAPEQKPATQLQCKRVISWLIVIHGLLLGLVALLLPIPAMIVGTGLVSVSIAVCMVASVMYFRKAMQSPGTS